jgi:hypothetical protein
MRKFKTLATWIAEALSDSDKENACSAMACVYLKASGGTREVHSVKLTGKTWEAKSLGELFQGKAETYAQDLPGISSFELQAFYGGNEPQAVHPFVIADGEIQAEGRSRNIRESADGQGIIAQSMRHVERMHDTLVKVFETVMVNTVQRERNWAEREHALQQEVTDGYTIIREMMMKASNEDHEKRLSELRFMRESRERSDFIKHLPMLVNRASGREVYPEGMVDTILVESLAENISPDMLDNFLKMAKVKPELAGMLTSRLGEILDKRKQEAEELKRIPPANKDPKEDAAGAAPAVRLITEAPRPTEEQRIQKKQ